MPAPEASGRHAHFQISLQYGASQRQVMLELFSKNRLLTLIGVLSLSAAALSPAAAQQAPLRIGLAASANNKAIEAVIPRAKAAGLDVKLIEFTDWSMPNTALMENRLTSISISTFLIWNRPRKAMATILFRSGSASFRWPASTPTASRIYPN